MSARVNQKDFVNYLAEAKSWETDRVRILEKSVKTAWTVAIGFGVLALISVVTVAVLGPQKTAVPYVIRVNNVTGAVDVVNAMKDGATNYDEVMNKYHLQWYVRWREGYSANTINEYYNNVGLMSAPDEQTRYATQISKRNPQSPLNLYGDQGLVQVTIKSISFINENTALVRYIKGVEKVTNPSVTHWVATITFGYNGTPMSEKDRAVNPLGFQVTEYRIDPDQEITANALRDTAMPQDYALPLPSTAAPVVPPIQAPIQ